MQKSDRTTKKTIKSNSRGRCPDGAPNPIDVYVGQRIRTRRLLLGMSQEKFAALMGVSFQQIQKYEKGNNRIGASRLWDISKLLKTDLNFFLKICRRRLQTGVREALCSIPTLLTTVTIIRCRLVWKIQMKRRNCCLIISKFVTGWLPAMFLICFKFWQ